MPNKVQRMQGSPNFMRCVLEKDIASFNWDNGVVYFQKVKDTSRDGDGRVRLVYTSIYQLVLVGKPRNFYIHFYYDQRENYAKVDISPIISKILAHRDNLDVQKILDRKEMQDK